MHLKAEWNKNLSSGFACVFDAGALIGVSAEKRMDHDHALCVPGRQMVLAQCIGCVRAAELGI